MRKLLDIGCTGLICTTFWSIFFNMVKMGPASQLKRGNMSATKPDSSCSFPGTHLGEGDSWLKSLFLWKLPSSQSPLTYPVGFDHTTSYGLVLCLYKEQPLWRSIVRAKTELVKDNEHSIWQAHPAEVNRKGLLPQHRTADGVRREHTVSSPAQRSAGE